MQDTFYKVVRLVGVPFRYRCIGLDNVARCGPAIFVANHLNAIGPIQAILSVPLRLYPWVIAEMADPRRAARYLYDDLIHPTWHLSGRTGLAVSLALSRIGTAIINGIGSVPVDRNQGNYWSPFPRSLELLHQGRNLLVFPENSAHLEDPDVLMKPFFCGFALLCAMYERDMGQRLPIHPLVISPPSRTVAIGPARFLDQRAARLRVAVENVCHRLYEDMAQMYRSLRGGLVRYF